MPSHRPGPALTRRHWRAQLAAWLLASLAWTLSAGAARAQEAPPLQVLVLLSYHAQLPWTRAVLNGLLDEAAGQPVSLDLQLLDQQRADSPALNADRARLILARYQARRPDVIIAESLPAVQFQQRHLAAALDGVPVVAMLEGQGRPLDTQLAAEVTVETRLAETIDLALRLHQPTRVYLIGGPAPESQSTLDAMQALLHTRPGLQVERLDSPGLTPIAHRLAAVPAQERAVAFYGLVFSDDKGEPLPPALALSRIAQTSQVPIYSFWDPMIGRGALGGYVTVPQGVGRQLLQEAVRAARPPSSVASAAPSPRQQTAQATLAFDARQLARWGLSAERLPADADLRFQAFSVWREHRLEIIGALLLLVLQAVLIGGLLVNRRGRLRAMQALARERSSLEDRVVERTRQLAETELRYRTVADHNANWETWNDPQGRWLYCSPSCQRITGRDAQDFIHDGGLFTRIVHPEDRARVEQHMASTARADGDFAAFDFRIRHAEGHDLWLSHVCQPVFDAEGGFLGHRASNIDITARKVAELALRASEARLRQANEVAETAARAKSQFLSNMSHELRTPLNGILGMGALARMKTTEPEVARLLGMLEVSSKRLADLIASLLDATALQNDQLTLDRRRFRLGEVLSDVLEQAAAAAADKHLSFSVDTDAGLLDTPVVGDGPRLAQVLGNLAGNAVKFTDQGGVSVRLGLRDDGPAALQLRCDVVDSGPGIDEATQRRLFVAFVQADGSSTRPHQGAGLGLAVSKRLVEAMGGRMGLDSRPGQGSTFWFTVRLTRAG
ncbi:PAS domain-containing protein [Ideonella sp. 4Y16]|uniref:Virulence sensor protein BvgS n=1 Tax=Ideonella alba TaxID=2824118 RepID=A0A940Y6A2_9BURK|nr:ATP-binding protein [Ideonella alba]MBQ0929548.1 PAS domain-containing protein [Ideonella alba]MBQ0944650.1 PAS domain-containing protein [Ideonella alba]